MSKDIKEKRFGVAIGMCVLSDDVKPMMASPLYYGKLTYEDMVQLQSIVAKYKSQMDSLLEPLIAELIEIGVTQADEVAKARVEGKS